MNEISGELIMAGIISIIFLISFWILCYNVSQIKNILYKNDINFQYEFEKHLSFKDMVQAKEVFKNWYWHKLNKIDRNMTSAGKEIDDLNNYFSHHMKVLGISTPPEISSIKNNVEEKNSWPGAKN